MATLEEVIDDALLYLDRPDLLDVARRSAREVLYKCHRIEDFSRDVSYSTAENVSATDATTTLTLPADFRKLVGVIGLGDTGLPLDAYAPKLAGVAAPMSYAGLRPSEDRYRIAGSQLTVLHYSLIRPTQVQLAYYAYPSFTVAGDGSVSSNSWMLESFDDVVRWRLCMQLQGLADDKRVSTATAFFNESRNGLIANEAVDLPEGY